MDLSTIQKSGENINSQQQQQKKNQEKSMEKLRETILKLSNKEPNVPLSQTKNSILRKHLNRFLSGLYSTPVHPPYTWMIEKALQGLGEEGGSSEDSISEFIKKEHGSLPLAHMTLLQHHLHKMTEKGEILMIDGGRFLLPGDNERANPKRKMKRKRRYSSIKQKKPQEKEKKEEDTQNEVHLEQPIKQHRGRSAKYKEVGAKIDGNTTSALKTNGPQDEVPVEEPKDKRHGRALKDDKCHGRALKGQEERRYSSIKRKKPKQKEKKKEDTQNEVHLEQPMKQHRGRSAKYKEVGAKIDGSRTKALATNDPQVPMKEPKDKGRERALKGDKRHGRALKGQEERRYSSIKRKKPQQREKEEDTQNEVHLEQPIKQRQRRPAKYKVVGAKIDRTTSALTTNDPEDGVCMKERKDKHCERALKGQEDGADPDTTLLKDLRLPKKLTKTSRSRKAQ